VTAIETYPIPVNLKQLRAFLGLSGYYRRFVMDYSRIASPLYELTKKNDNFIWTDKCQNSFDSLKAALVSPAILGFPCYDQPFKLYTDASSFSVGAVLCQEQDGIERVISHADRSLSNSERNFGISEKECLALVYAVKQFDCFLRHNYFEAYVDHSALKWLLTMNETARWRAVIQTYNYNVKVRPGRDTLTLMEFLEERTMKRPSHPMTRINFQSSNVSVRMIRLKVGLIHRLQNRKQKPLLSKLQQLI
jgi:hypothetical protein